MHGPMNVKSTVVLETMWTVSLYDKRDSVYGGQQSTSRFLNENGDSACME